MARGTTRTWVRGLLAALLCHARSTSRMTSPSFEVDIDLFATGLPMGQNTCAWLTAATSCGTGAPADLLRMQGWPMEPARCSHTTMFSHSALLLSPSFGALAGLGTVLSVTAELHLGVPAS